MSLATLVVLIFLAAGITAGALENKPFAPGPALAYLLRLTGRLELATDLATGRKEPSDRSFTGLVQDRAGEVKEELDKLATELPRDLSGQIEPRAMSCPKGSYENIIPKIPSASVESVKNKQFSILWQLQAALGQPHCVERYRWTWFGDDGRMVVAEEKPNKRGVDVKVQGFSVK
ncbi:MAG: hypothetical protein F6K35_03770 [Okeania sp. SIO2H7]|nr:hypothetical protein [Okeania sp. SIO2H7]